jgi:hypothetical protein
MAQYNLQLRGWQAVAGLVVLGGITGVQMYSRVRPVSDAVREAVHTKLLEEYSGRGPKDIARFAAEFRKGEPVEPMPALVQCDVEFTSIAARGRMGGTAVVVRTEVIVDGGPPPDGRAVRYFWVVRKFGVEGSWGVTSETNSYRYFGHCCPELRARGQLFFGMFLM